MATLTGNKIKDSYLGLLKSLNSGSIGGSLVQISDGNGNGLPLYLSTSAIKFYNAYTFPSSDGTVSGQVLSTDANGTLSWVTSSDDQTLEEVLTSGNTTSTAILSTANGNTFGSTTFNGVATLANNSVVSGTPPSANDSSTKIATTAYVDTQVGTSVTSVALSVPTGLTVSGSPITTSGTITIGGTLGVANGGTGATTLTGILVGNGTSAISAVTDGTVSGQLLSTNANGTYSFINAPIGDVTVSGTPTANQIAIWTDSDTIKGMSTLTIDTDGAITLSQPNSTPSTTNSYNIGGGNIANVTGSSNCGFGQDNMQRVTTGGDNTAFGNGVLDKLTIGQSNVGVGKSALFALTEGDDNIAIGATSLSTVTTGNNNIALGKDSGLTLSTGSSNIFIGKDSGRIATGSNNTFLGNSSGSAISTGSKNVMIGSNTDFVDGLNNYIVLSDGDGNVRMHFDNNGQFSLFNELFFRDSSVTGSPIMLQITKASYTATSPYNTNKFNAINNSHIAFQSDGVDTLTISSTGAVTFNGTLDVGSFTISGSGIIADSGMTLQVSGGSANALTLAATTGLATFSSSIILNNNEGIFWEATSGANEGIASNGSDLLFYTAGVNHFTVGVGGYLIQNSSSDSSLYFQLKNQGTTIGFLGNDSSLANAPNSTTQVVLRSETDMAFCTNGGNRRITISSSGVVTLPSGNNPDMDIYGTLVVRGNSSASSTHLFTTAAANVAKYEMKDASGNIKNLFSAGGENYITGGNFGVGSGPLTSPNSADTSLSVYAAQDSSIILGDSVETWEILCDDQLSFSYGSTPTTVLTLKRTTGKVQMSSIRDGATLNVKACGTQVYNGLNVFRQSDEQNWIYASHIGSKAVIGESYLGSSSYNPLVLQTSEQDRLEISTTGNIGINRTPHSDYKLYMMGDTTTSAGYIFVTLNSDGFGVLHARNDGAVYAGLIATDSGTDLVLNSSGFICKKSSSIRYKKDVENIDIGLDFILSLNPVKYNLKSNDQKQVGFIAEDFPDERFVSYSQVDTKDESKGTQKEAVNYSQLTAVLTKAIQEQQVIINNLKSRIEKLEK